VGGCSGVSSVIERHELSVTSRNHLMFCRPLPTLHHDSASRLVEESVLRRLPTRP
jgi:hypothetical protein